jgi:LysR family transcriptional activator of nhaA
MVQLNYHHLYYFKVIATEGTISKAAIKLSLGQPTLSMQLKQFEEFLGHQLFERKNRSLALTEMGKVVLGYANEIFRLGGEMLEAVQDRPTSKKLRLHIGALDSVPKALVQNLMLKAFEVGDCTVTTLEGQAPELIKELMEHRLDLVISNSVAPTLNNEMIFAKSLAKMPLVIAGADRFKNLSRNFPQSLSEQPFVLPTAHSRVRHEFEHYLSDHVIHVDMVAEVQDTSLMKSLALAGHGLIVVAEDAIKDHLEGGRLVKIGAIDNYFEEIWLIAAQRKMQNPIAQALLKRFEFDLTT